MDVPGSRPQSLAAARLAAVVLVLLTACAAEGGEGAGGRPDGARSGGAGQSAGMGQAGPSGPAAAERRPAAMVTFPSGRIFFADLAITPADQARGYMGRRHIDPEEALLFIYKRAGIRTFWMKNCLVPLDIIWLDRENRVVHIEHGTPPCPADPCPSYGPSVPTYNVLEVAAGVAREEGLEAGDRLQVVADPDTP